MEAKLTLMILISSQPLPIQDDPCSNSEFVGGKNGLDVEKRSLFQNQWNVWKVYFQPPDGPIDVPLLSQKSDFLKFHHPKLYFVSGSWCLSIFPNFLYFLRSVLSLTEFLYHLPLPPLWMAEQVDWEAELGSHPLLPTPNSCIWGAYQVFWTWHVWYLGLQIWYFGLGAFGILGCIWF